MSNIINIDKKNYTNYANEDKVLVLDFWAYWCGPCKAFSPIFEAAAVEHENGFIFGKVNADEESELCKDFGIRGIPTIVVVKKERVIAQRVGAMTKSQFEEFLKDLK